MAEQPAPLIRRRSPSDTLEYIAARLEAAVEDGTEETLRTVAFQTVVGLRVLAAEVAGAPMHRALGPISEPARHIHRCDERCVCPADGKPLAYAPAHGLHACSDPDCRYAHPRGQEDDRG